MGLLIAGLVLLTLTLGTTIGYKLLMPAFVSGEIKEGELTKKYELADIYKFRQTIFISALLISLIFAWILIEYKTYFSIPKAEDTVMMNVEDEPIAIIITEILPPPPPQPKTVVIEVVPDTEIIEDETPLEDPEKEPEPVEEEIEYSDVEEEVVDDKIYYAHEIQQHAEFPGGTQEELLKYIANNYVRHSRDVQNGTSGRIQVAFVVEKDGSVSSVKIMRGLSSTADAEAERVIKSMPKWKPAKMGGLPVREQFSIPILLE